MTHRETPGRPKLSEYDFRKDYWRALFDWCKLNGICIRCKNRKADSGKATCLKCRERQKVVTANYRARLKRKAYAAADRYICHLISSGQTV